VRIGTVGSLILLTGEEARTTFSVGTQLLRVPFLFQLWSRSCY